MLTTIAVRLRALFRRGDIEAELDEELRLHLDREVARNVAAGAKERHVAVVDGSLRVVRVRRHAEFLPPSQMDLRTLRMPAVLLCAAALHVSVAAAQMPRVGLIEFYGVRTIPVGRLRQALGVGIGDSLSARREELVARIKGVPGVRDAAIGAVCCEAGRMIVYVGVQEGAAPAATWYPAPTGAVRLPREIVDAGEGATRAGRRRARIADGVGRDALSHGPVVRDQCDGSADVRRRHRVAGALGARRVLVSGAPRDGRRPDGCASP